MKFSVQTFGCQMNTSDSERIQTVMKQMGFEYEQDQSKADLVIMNTCSVKQKAEDKVWGHVKKSIKAKKINPNARLAITGCMVRETGVSKQYDEEHYSKDRLLQSSEHIDLVFRIEDLPHMPKYVSQLYDTQLGQDHEEEVGSYFGIKPDYEKSFQVFVPVQTGCNKFCTYCIVPFTRKREISRSMPEILEEVKRLVADGAKEVTLLGQTVNSYRHESSTNEYSGNNFAELLYHINQIDGLDRIRYTSPHPMDMDPELIRAHKELHKLCPHVHLPLQSGDNNVLRRMNRKYTVERFMEVVRDFREAVPHITITTDVIVGFCGETDEEFEQTCRVFEEAGFDMSFTSRYSPRTGTYSEKRLEDDVPASEKARRWHKLNELLINMVREKNKQFKDTVLSVLVERQLPNGMLEGYSREYKRVQFPGKSTLIGTVVPVKITQTMEFVLHGKILTH